MRLPPWAAGQGRRRWFTRRRLAYAGILVLLVGLVAWLNYPFLPDPVILLSRRPVTNLSSASSPGQWSMSGRDLQLTRYLASVPRQPEGRVVWSLYLGEATRSAPSVVDGIAYVGSHFKILALDAATGRVVWERETTGPVHPSLAVAGDNLYLGLLDHRVLALERRTGEVRWEFKTQDAITASPAVANGIVYAPSWDGFIYALDAATGKPIWKYETKGPVRASPAIHDGVLFVTDTNGNLHTVNARTGQSRLRFRTTGSATASPVVANGLVYFPAEGRVYAVGAGAQQIPGEYQLKAVWAQFWIWRVPGIPRPPGQKGGRWRFTPEKSHGIITSPAVTPEAFYVGDTGGNFYARDALLGTERWRFRAGGAILGSPVVLGERVYFGARDGFLYALDRSSGQAVWKLSLGSPIEVSPVFAADRLYVRTADGRLHAIE